MKICDKSIRKGNLNSRVSIQLSRFDSQALDSILDFLITFSEYSFNTKAIDISKKLTVNISLQIIK